MSAYYNENDPFAAEWLRELIKAGHIAPGDVDDRSIVDVTPVDLKPYDQCHFFAGIGVWSYALRQARWPDNKPVWTGSCPCQPFSAAGKRAGAGDDRDLWWAFFWLIQQCRPETVFGEQVSSKDGLTWWDTVQTDLEGAGYAAATFDLCAAGVGAPHIRQRLYWVADVESSGPQGHGRSVGEHVPSGRATEGRHGAEGGDASGMGDADEIGRQQFSVFTGGIETGMGSARGKPIQSGKTNNGASGLANPEGPRRRVFDTAHLGAPDAPSNVLADADRSAVDGQQRSASMRPSPLHGPWRDADWLFCRDGKWRPVEPGTFPLAHGATARVGRLRGYGNAIVAPLAQAFIEAYQEVIC